MPNKLTKTRIFCILLSATVLMYLFFSKQPANQNQITKTQNPQDLTELKKEITISDDNQQQNFSYTQKTHSKKTVKPENKKHQPNRQVLDQPIGSNESSITYKLNEKQKENLANEADITQKGWLIHPYESKDANGNPNPILKYVPHLDNQGNFHSVSIYDFNLRIGEQLAYAYPIPYTSEFPPISVEKASEIFLKKWNNERYEIKDANKLVWLTDDRYTPYRLYSCKTKQKEKIYKRNGREIKILVPREVTNSYCLINAYSGHMRWGDRIVSLEVE